MWNRRNDRQACTEPRTSCWTDCGVSNTAATTPRGSRSRPRETGSRPPSRSAAPSASSPTSKTTCATAPLEGHVGIGHTRWATHGKPSEQNAHPQRAGAVAIVHNGIIENYLELRNELEAAGCEIASETDTELIAHLVDRSMKAGCGSADGGARRPASASRAPTRSAALCETDPSHLVAARNGGSPDHPRRGRRAGLPRQRHPCHPALHAADDLPDGRRLRGDRSRADPGGRHRRPSRRPRAEDREPRSGLGGEGRLRPLHAEGDLRAAPGHRRHDRRRASTRPTRRSISTASSSPATRSRRSHASRWSPAAPRPTRAWSAST